MYLCAITNKLSDIMPRQERLHSATGIYHVMFRMKNDGTFGPIDDLYIQNGKKVVIK